MVSFQTVGSCKVLADQAGNSNWNAATQNSQTFTVGKGAPTLSFTSSASNPKVSGNYSPVASSSSTGVVTYTIDASSAAVCSISAGVVTFNTVGTCKVNANQVTDANWLAAGQVQQSIIVSKGDQTISFSSTAPTGAVVAGASYTPTATAPSGDAVVFTIDAASASVCSITSGSVTFQAAGTCKVLANQAGNTNWNAATQVFQSFTVGKGTANLAFTSSALSPKVGTTYTPAASSPGGGAVSYTIDSASTSVCSINAGLVSFLTVGTCKVNASQLTDSNWLAVALVQQTITVAKGEQSLAFTSTAPTAAVVDGDGYTPTATGGSSTSSVIISIDTSSTAYCTITGGVVYFHAQGDCMVKASQAGDTNFNAATAVTQTLSVGKGSQTLTITSTAPTNAVVDGPTYAVTAQGGNSISPIAITIDSSAVSICSISSGVIAFLAAGDCVVKVNQAGDANYNAASAVTQTITVGKGSQVVAFTSSVPTGVRVGDTGYTPTASGGASSSSVAISVAPSSSQICSITAGVVSFTAVGSCVLDVNQAGDVNYTAASAVSQTISVAKGLQVITKTSTDPLDAVVDGATYTPSFTGGGSGEGVSISIPSSSSAVCTLANGTISFIAAGDCAYYLNQAGTSNYEAAPQLLYTISVGKGAQVVAFTSTAPTAAVVGGTTYSPTATGGASGNAVTFRVDVNTASVCSISAGVVRFVGVGTCTVTANQVGSSNYNAAVAQSQTFTVGKGAQVISFLSSAPTNAVVAGATYTPLAYGGATGNTVSLSVASASTSICALAFGKISFLTVGDCVIEANQAGNTNYNAASQVIQTITVAKGAQVVAFTSAAPSAKVSGATYTPVVSGGASGNVASLSIAASSGSVCSVTNGVVSFNAVGSCEVEVNQSGNANYEAAAQAIQTITVTKGSQVLAFTSTPPSLRPVQGTTYTPTATYGPSGEPVVYTIDALAATICTISSGVISFQAVGDCILHADQAGTANYTAATRITQIFDITKGEQVVAFNSTAPVSAVVDGATYTPRGTGGAGTKPVAFSATAESDGICAVLVGVVYFQGAGDCVIEIGQAGDINYNAATPKYQTITVGKGSQNITFSSNFTTATVDGAIYTPTAIGGSGINSVHFTIASSSLEICEINSGAISFHAVGNCVIEANQAEDSNYTAAAMVAQTITVAKGTGATLVGHSSISTLTLGTSAPTAVLTTTGGSGTGAVTWSVNSGSEAYCSVSGDVVSGLASGYCDLTATKGSDDNYLVASATLTLVVSTGGQTPVRTSVSNSTPTYANNLTLDLSLAGGDGDGTVWFESLTTHVCNVTNGSSLAIYHAGTCTVVGHKDGDDNFEAVSDLITFDIAKARQSGATIHLANALVYSPGGSVSAAISLVDVQSDGAVSFSVSNGTCSIVDGELTATEAGDCEVTATMLGDDRYLDGSVIETFTVAKAAQSAIGATLAENAPAAISWNGVKVTNFNVTGGSGVVDYSVATSTPAICSVAIADGVVTVTGISQGTCDASVSNATSINYLAASTLFSVEVLDLSAAPTAVTASAPVRGEARTLTTTISWTPALASATNAEVTGFRVESKVGTSDWDLVADGTVDSATNSLVVTVTPWTKYKFRVAATSALDGDTLNWKYFDLTNDEVPDVLSVGGGAVLLSTTKAATTSGETVYIDGSGFVQGVTTQVQLTSTTGIFAAGLRPAAAALVTTKILPATFISATRLSFTLPKITLPKGVASLSTQIKVLAPSEGLVSDPIPLEYIPKKLAQTLTAVLPTLNTIMTMTAPLISTGTVTSSSADNPPVVTATPASVCTASINVLNKLVVTPVSPGKCSISVVVPATPAYLVSATKTTVVYIKTNRTAGLTATADSVTSAGVHTPTTFNVTSGLSNTAVSVVVGENAVEVPVTLNKREGAVLFTVDAASDAAGRCIADGGDASTGLVGTITMNDLGTCKVTVTLPADDGYYVGTETIVITVNGVALDPTVPVAQDLGDGVTSPEDTDLNPKDPDTEPAVAITLDPSRAADYSFGGEDGLMFDPLTKKLNVRSRTPLVGVWTATLTSPDVNKTWFKIPGKIVKKVQTYTYSNICKLTLTVKKDPKLKKKVTRIVGAGCILSSANEVKPGKEAGWAALTSVGIQKIKVKYKRVRQYAKTGLSYVKTKGNRVLKNINRTWVVKIGRRP